MSVHRFTIADLGVDVVTAVGVTHLVVEDDLETLGVGADGLPGDGLRTTGIPLGVLTRAGDLDGIDDSQESDGGDDDFGEHCWATKDQSMSSIFS